MSAIILSSGPASRRIVCARCGTAFDCGVGGDKGGCWCADETFQLPMPVTAGEDCLCPACLRAAAAASGQRA